MEIGTLEILSLKELTAAFNLAFSDYLIKMELSEARMAYKISMENIRLEQSFGMYDGSVLAGFILLASEQGGAQVYNAGTGVLPAYRGQGITRRLYEQIIPFYYQLGIREHVLEVITENSRALHAYEAIGFRRVRQLACFKGLIQGRLLPKLDIRLQPAWDPERYTPFWEVEPSWQNSNASLGRLGKDLQVLEAFLNQQLIGYLAFVQETARVHQFGVHPAYRRQGIAAGLFQELSTRFPLGQQFSLINVDTRSKASLGFLTAMGLTNFLDQYEMRMQVR